MLCLAEGKHCTHVSGMNAACMLQCLDTWYSSHANVMTLLALLAATVTVSVEADIASNMSLSAQRPHLNSTEQYM